MAQESNLTDVSKEQEVKRKFGDVMVFFCMHVVCSCWTGASGRVRFARHSRATAQTQLCNALRSMDQLRRSRTHGTPEIGQANRRIQKRLSGRAIGLLEEGRSVSRARHERTSRCRLYLFLEILDVIAILARASVLLEL